MVETAGMATATNPPEKREFHITDAESAGWLLRKLANNAAEVARVKAQAADIIRSLEADSERLNHLYGAELEAFTRAELAKKGNRGKTLRLLQGSCSFRTVPDSLRLDPAAALDHATAIGCTRQTVELDT